MTAPTLPMAGVDTTRLWSVFNHIQSHPELWDQGHYRVRCEDGIAHDFAGWTVELDGATWVDNRLVLANGDDPAHHIHVVVRAGHKVVAVRVRDRAQRLLGLSEEEAWNLLDLEDADFERLYVRVEEIAGRELTEYIADLLRRSDRALDILTAVLAARTPQEFYAARTAQLAFAEQEAAYLRDRATTPTPSSFKEF